MVDEPSCFIGDFNDILNQDEKVRKHLKLPIQIEEFRDLVNKNNLMDLELKGSKFTWFSNPRDGVVTRERIDSALVNWKWKQMFNHARLTALPAISSDHCLLILDMRLNKKISKLFRYESYWDDREDCKEVIKKGWIGGNNNGDDWKNLIKKNKELHQGQGKRVKVWKDNCIYGLNQPLDKENNEDLRVEDLISSSKEHRRLPNMLYFYVNGQEQYGLARKLNVHPQRKANEKNFHDTEPNPKSTINYAKNLELEYFKATQKEHNSTKESNKRRTVPIIWRAPPQNWLKLNTDAAFSNDTKSGSVAEVIRDCNGALMGRTTSKIQTNSSILAEATAIREAIILIENLKIENATIESDCFQLIQAIKEEKIFWEVEVEPIIQDIKAIQKRLTNCGFS
ncbi:hypothetical protein Ahy_B10g105840 [Arachis hypogaea]|uniref:RNase H type-1 domain-containing protein n=1 Tax=Arachis hypogaea TaxID=3818 RepID=A0A444X901_ARAHY|nr:hypothetical protein Ahy_B10g105840 [Arachis hypogaea]